MSKRVGAVAIVVTGLAATAGLFAGPSNSASSVCPKPRVPYPQGCGVSLTATGPLPSTVRMPAEWALEFFNADSVTHTVVFANGLCTLTVTPGEPAHPGYGATCNSHFSSYVGSYAYMVDGKFPGIVVTTPLSRSVSLTARTHTIRGGTRLTLHGQVTRSNSCCSPPPPVVVLVRHSRAQPFEPVATVRTRGSDQATNGWKLDVRPDVPTTYIAEVTAQRLCYFPASRCAHPQGQVWADARSRAFTVRIRHQTHRTLNQHGALAMAPRQPRQGGAT
jgi:hypothetical protein